MSSSASRSSRRPPERLEANYIYSRLCSEIDINLQLQDLSGIALLLQFQNFHTQKTGFFWFKVGRICYQTNIKICFAPKTLDRQPSAIDLGPILSVPCWWSLHGHSPGGLLEEDFLEETSAPFLGHKPQCLNRSTQTWSAILLAQVQMTSEGELSSKGK